MAVFCSLHTDIQDPLERIKAISVSSDLAKKDGEVSPMVDVLRLVGAVSPAVAKTAAGIWSRNHLSRHLPVNISTVVTNVPGPNFDLYCTGARLVDYYGLGVLTPGMGIFHAVFSYADKVTLSVLADRDIIPDPEFYHDCLVASYEELYAAATALANAGERVLIVDYDAHHGNGTQDIFYDDERVLFVSYHQWPCYPGTGRIIESGQGTAVGTTINVPLPPGATGDVYNQAWDRHVAAHVDRFEPTWVLISAGFDAHRADPITDMGLSAGDYALLTKRILEIAPAGRRIVFLEGGYDLQALTESAAAVMAALVEQSFTTEKVTNGGPGVEMIDMAIRHFETLP